jgi:hypothetical protein
VKNRRARFGHGLAAVLACTQGPAVHAYNLSSYPWAGPETTFYVEILGAGAVWNATFEDAMAQWSDDTIFNYRTVRNQFRNPCNSPSAFPPARNGVNMSSTECGDSWGSGVLAVAVIYSSGGERIQAGVLFNSNYSWAAYSGPLQPSVPDFRRVAVHELGHALGLGHEDIKPAIMGTYIGAIENPTVDDIAGVQALYGPPPDITPNPFSFVDQSDVPVSTVITSAPVTITGISPAAPVSVVGGTYSLGCGGTFTSAAGTIISNQTVCVRHSSAPTPGTPVNTILTVGDFPDVFTSWTSAVLPDTDGDGVPDASDNCTLVANPGQCDSDGDGYGNHCDGDLNNNGVTNAFDAPLFREQIGLPSVGPAYNPADLDCSGAVSAFDTPLFRQLLGAPPGPSGLVP